MDLYASLPCGTGKRHPAEEGTPPGGQAMDAGAAGADGDKTDGHHRQARKAT